MSMMAARAMMTTHTTTTTTTVANRQQQQQQQQRFSSGGVKRVRKTSMRGLSDPGDWACPMSGCPVDELKSKRLITAIKTPYLESGKVDLYAYDALVEAQIAGGVEGLIVGGTTGEGQLMSWDEHIMLIAHTCSRYGGRVKVIGNTGSNSTREAVHATQQGFAVGMDASLQINPYYGKTSKRGLLEHFNAVMDLGPAIIYNVPARTSQDITPEIMFELAKHANFAGVKECEGNERIKGYTDKGVTCWTGNDDECHDARYEAGAVGVISVTSNLVPELMREMLFDGPNPKLRDELAPLMNWLFAEPNPTGINTATAMLGVAKPVFRLPYVPYAADLRAQGAEHMRAVGLDRVVGTGSLRDLRDEDFTILRDW
jgi:4-hydroxy-tetrahydrodipicolinate synthase